MKAFLTRPRSIVGATIWGALTAVFVFFGLVVAAFVISMYRTNFGPANKIEAIAIGNDYSISLDAAPAHPWLAEYEQSISIFGGQPRQGSMLGRVEIPMSTGGRVRIGVLVPVGQPVQAVVLADRYFTTHIDLASRKTSNQPTWKDSDLKPLGIISGESYPIKYIPCEVWPMLSVAEQASIIHQEDKLQGFCGAVQPSVPPDVPASAAPPLQPGRGETGTLGTSMKVHLAYLLTIFTGVSSGAEPNRVLETDLVWALAGAHTIAERGAVKVIAVADSINDCESFASCPNISLYIVIAEGDQGETPSVYRLPKAKGWTFGKWVEKSEPGHEFTVKTNFPGDNIKPAEHKAFHPIEYRVQVLGNKVTYVRR